jgi:flagellar hook-associated protein 1 FlgK
LVSERQSIDQELQVRVGEVNSMASAIANLNEQISEIESTGGQANDLRDQRTILLNSLSELVDTQVSESSNGQINVYIGGQILVQGDLATSIATMERSVPGGAVHDLVWTDGGASVITSGGQIAGLIEMRDERIPEVMERMDELANTLVTQVNSLHQTGYGLNGASGNDFFDPETTGARNINLSGAVLDSLEVIAASGSGAPGDNSIALAIAGLQRELLMENGTATIGDYYASMVSEVGIVRQNSTFRYNQESASLTQLETQRESISGVNLDEEMTNLIQYQQAYEAAARLVSTVSEMMDTVLTLGL